MRLHSCNSKLNSNQVIYVGVPCMSGFVTHVFHGPDEVDVAIVFGSMVI